MNVLKTMLFFAFVVAFFSKAEAQHYDSIKVDAPFDMPTIKLYRHPAQDFSIIDYGAEENSVDSNTKAIAKAMEACHTAGGGRVVVPTGKWLTGPIHFKSNVNLHLEDNAVLVFVDRPALYLPAVMTSWEGMECYNYSPLIYAYSCENIAITGLGSLQPQMSTWKEWFGRPQPHLDALRKLYHMASKDVPVEERQMAKGQNHLRPHLIHFNRCKNILLDGFSIRESPFWTIHMYMSDGGIVRNLHVRAHGHNNDGIDIEMTKNFLVENCVFDQGDDAVVIKAGRNRDAWRLNTPTENIVVRHCKIVNGHTMLGIGSEISGGVRNVYMHDCSAQDVRRFLFVKTNHRRGGFVERIFLRDLTSKRTDRVFEIDTDVLYQWRDLVPTYETKYTAIQDIFLENIRCEEAGAVYELKGEKNLPAKNISLKNVQVETVRDFIRKVQHVEGVTEENLLVKNLLHK